MQIMMMADNVLVRPLPAAELSRGGVYLPFQARRPSWRGMIAAAGPRAQDSGVDQGDDVVFDAKKGQDLKVGDDFLIIMRVEHVIAIYRGDEDDGEK